jgi:quercetin dioxygenase-like cupin family protein
VKITTRSDITAGEPMNPATFTGPASSHPLLSGTEPMPVRAGIVHFPTGVRNHWHHHAGGQILHVVDGEGYVQSRAEAARLIRAGDTVTAAPGEEHWHGAGPAGPMSHLAVSIGDTTWLESSADEPI